MERKNGDYVVGYGKPPVQTRFQKGQSGNRKGRSKETRRLQSLEAILVKALNSTVVVNENQQSRQVTKYETAIMQIVNNAASGKLQFAKLLLELVQLLAMTSEHTPITTPTAGATGARERVIAKLDQLRERMEAREKAVAQPAE